MKEKVSEDLKGKTPRVIYNNWPWEELEELQGRRIEDIEPSLRSLRNLLGSREP